jgi:alcohol dehydrogenase class IV
LPHSIELNRAAFGGKYDIMSQAVGGDLAGRVRTLTRAVGIASPFAGQALREKETLIAETLASGSTHANPKAITRADVEWLLSRLFA